VLPLKLEDLNFSSGKLHLIRDISVTLEAPGVTVLMGPNGAGKSLLLRLIHGLLKPNGGRVLWNGKKPNKAVRAKQAMVFQRPVLLRRSVQANIEFVLRKRKLPVDQDYCAELLQRVGLQGMQDRPARLLSGGEQQRLALARALVTRPRVLFLDEPSASLDPTSTLTIESIIKELAQDGIKIIYVTHDVAQARRLADEVVFIHRGKLLEHAAASDFFAKPQTEEARQYLAGEIVI
jgi:tungstate transport system ATP-binding protein